MWNQHPNGIKWDKQKDSLEFKHQIAKIAMLLARARGIVKKHESEDEEYFVQIEKASRLNQLLYNFARGNAVAHGRIYLMQEDIQQALIVAVESAPPARASLILHLLKNSGQSNSSKLMGALKKSKPTALSLTEKLAELGVIQKNRNELNPIDPTNIILKEEFLPLTEFFPTQGEKNLTH